MTLAEIFILLTASAIIQASFQLSVSMVTVMSGHALGKKTSLTRLSRMVAAFTLGVMTMTALCVSLFALILTNVFPETPILLWSILSGLMVGIGLAVWFFYYRYRTSGTVLWIPRPLATYLTKRSRATSMAPEAFALGTTSVVGEIVFNGVTSLFAAVLLTHLAPPQQLVGLLLYVVVATLPLFLIVLHISGGGSLARIQRWRERNKRFLQFAAGSALIILGVYVYVETVLTPLASGAQV
ncbi:MAG TPA: hypothetical protein VL362_00015 [Patescibacteria group bacterium]|jgi:hypothetical protein|nr:hypothetical protein [Patescibacteria group bacterium]